MVVVMLCRVAVLKTTTTTTTATTTTTTTATTTTYITYSLSISFVDSDLRRAYANILSARIFRNGGRLGVVVYSI